MPPALRQQRGPDQKREGQQRTDPAVAELHVRKGHFALDRQRHFLETQPLKHIKNGQRVGQHGQRKVVTLQAQGRQTDQQS